ncbi:hypothetical protein MMC20_007978 [Loxospora ochrophaea]|nr:hypothetical protein [Loxospora ochrophaea]
MQGEFHSSLDAATAAQLPRILCLHGGGTSAVIFSIQTIRLQRVLGRHFHFVFVDAPFPSGPGPDVLPVFEGCGPYYMWHQPPRETYEEVLAVIRKRMDEDGGHFVGCLGFSQGAKMVAGLLQEQQDGRLPLGVEFQFGVVLNGADGPLPLSSQTFDPTTGGNLQQPDGEYQISVPSIHVHGLEDAIYNRSKRLAIYFKPSTMTVFEFRIGHHLPASAPENNQLAEAILKLYHK